MGHSLIDLEEAPLLEGPHVQGDRRKMELGAEE